MATSNITTLNVYNIPSPINLTCELSLTNSPLKVIVDAKYYSVLISVSNCYLLESGYVQSTFGFMNGKSIRLHKFIMILEGKLVEGLNIDHIDRNKLNNCSFNLRMVTTKENSHNRGKRQGCSSEYVGVSWSYRDRKWEAYIKHNGKKSYLGSYTSENEALANIPIREDVKVYNFH